MKKRFVSMLLALAMCMGLAVPGFAAENSDEEIVADFACDAMTVSADVVDAVFSNHQISLAANNVDFCELSDIDIETELASLYLKIDKAKKGLLNSSENSEADLESLVARKDYLEKVYESRGYIFLTDEEAQQLMGVSNVSPYAVGDKPNDTKNTRFVASEIDYAPLSDGSRVRFYTVTATPLTIENNNMVKTEIVRLNAKTVGDLKNALFETYVSKTVGYVASKVSVLSWLPYEMLINKNNMELNCSAYVDAALVSTAKFIWTYSETLNRYTLTAVTHNTAIENINNTKEVRNGAPYTTSKTQRYYAASPYYAVPKGLIRDIWDNKKPSPHIEYCAEVKYYYTPDENKPSSKELVKTLTAPYALNYYSLN